MNVKNQKFLILGLSKSGEAAARYILNKGGKCRLYEEKESPAIKETIDSLSTLGGVFVFGEEDDQILSDIDVVVVSPGVPINHRLLIKAKEKRILTNAFFH